MADPDVSGYSEAFKSLLARERAALADMPAFSANPRALEGSQHGRWVVVREYSRQHVWAVCTCGMLDDPVQRARLVSVSNLLHGYSRSCGCLNRDRLKSRREQGAGASGALWTET